MPQQSDDSRAARSSSWGYLQIALILVAIVVALYFARAPDRIARDTMPGAAQDEAKPTASVVQPVPAEQALTLELTGSVRMSEKATLTSEVTGRVAWVSPEFKSGGTLAAHESIVRIDSTEFDLRVQAAQRAVEAAEARVWMEKARGEEAAKAFSRENPDEEASDWVRRLPAIAKAEAKLKQARVELVLAKLRVERTNISLPYDSRVVNADVEVGELVGPAESVGRASSLGLVYRSGALQVEAPIEPLDLERLSPAIGRSAEIHSLGKVYAAQIARVSSVVAPKTRLANLFLEFSEEHEPDALPVPGTFVHVTISGPVRDNVYVLPEAAQQERNTVWLVKDGALSEFVPHTLGHISDGWVVEVFDAAGGVVLGTVPGAREGLEVQVENAGSQG